MYGIGFRRARGERSQGEAAKLLGVTRQYLNRVENNDKEPSFDLLKRMCVVYGVELGDLFPTSEPRATEFKPLAAELYSLPTDFRESIIFQLAGVSRLFIRAAERRVMSERVFLEPSRQTHYEGIGSAKEDRAGVAGPYAVPDALASSRQSSVSQKAKGKRPQAKKATERDRDR